MSKNGKLSLTPKAKGAAMRNREKMYYKALSFGIYNKPKSIADLCHEAWAAGYFYAKQESELFVDVDGHLLDDPLMVINAKPDFEGLGIPPIKEPKDIPQ